MAGPHLDGEGSPAVRAIRSHAAAILSVIMLQDSIQVARVVVFKTTQVTRLVHCADSQNKHCCEVCTSVDITSMHCLSPTGCQMQHLQDIHCNCLAILHWWWPQTILHCFGLPMLSNDTWCIMCHTDSGCFRGSVGLHPLIFATKPTSETGDASVQRH